MVSSKRTKEDASVDALSDSVGYLLFRLGSRAQRMFSQALAQTAMKVSHYGLAATLAPRGSMTQTELARASGVDARNLVALLDEMNRDGLVQRMKHPGDRRATHVSLTALGSVELAAAVALANEAEDRLLAPLSLPQRRQLSKLLQAISRAD